MALDRWLFEEFFQDPTALPLLRIYRLSGPGVTVGRSYGKRGLVRREVCVRPTGGGLVEHGKDLIYSVFARRDTFPTFHQVRTSYLSFHEAIQAAFEKLGIETHLMRCDDPRLRRSGARGAPARQDRSRCFTHPVATDLLWKEKKIAGGAQWRRGAAFLHQGSVLLPPGISFEGLRSTLISVFEKKFSIAWEVSPAC